MTRTKGTAPSTAKKKRRSNQVPGQLYGYSLQTTRAVAHLLRARQGQSVSVEHLDDVATSGAGVVVAEQDKSGLAHNPVADRSIELWKTLHNWVLAIRDGALQSDTKFILFVAQDHHGSVIDQIHAVKNRVDAATLVDALRTEFWGKAPGYAARTKLPGSLAEHVNGTLSASDDVLCLLFASVILENGSGSPNDDLLPLLGEKAISANAREQVLTFLLGWAKRALDKRIESKQPPILSWDEFQKQLLAAARKFDRSENVLTRTLSEITEAEVQKELRGRTYVRQLEAVSCEEGDLVRAVNDFLRSGVDRTTWSERGDVTECSFQDFEDGLERAWVSQKMCVDIEERTRTDDDRGRLVYARCMVLQTRLQGMDVPSYFVPGCFHTLAESLRLVWHPRYREIAATVSSPGPAANEQNEAAKEVLSVVPPRRRRTSTLPPPAPHSVADEGGGA